MFNAYFCNSINLQLMRKIGIDKNCSRGQEAGRSNANVAAMVSPRDNLEVICPHNNVSIIKISVNTTKRQIHVNKILII